MSRAGYLYRRSSGIYVVRICVPKRLQSVVGRGEIHVSTGVRDAAKAKAAAFRLLSQWQQRVLELDGMDVLKVIEGSPLLVGGGMIRLIDLAQEFGIDPKPLLMEVVNNRVSLHCVADGWHGIEVDDIYRVDKDFDGSFILNSVLEIGDRKIIGSQLVLFDSSMAAKQLIESGEYLGEVFFFDLRRFRAVFFDPGEIVRIDGLLLRKTDAERIRLSLSLGVTPAMLDAAKALRLPSVPVLTPTLPLPLRGHKFGSMLVSELVAEFLTGKKEDWKDDHHRNMSGICGTFVDLMDDPTLSAIDRSMIVSYRNKLHTLPKNLYQARRRHGEMPLVELAKVVSLAGEELISKANVKLYIRRLSEMLEWAVTEEFLPHNSASGVGATGKKEKREKREQDDRCVFDDDDLAKIFGAEWFQSGRGVLSGRGDYRFFQPHYYWLPLIGLYTGARLNELAQLHLNDVRQNKEGCWYFDFNLDGSEKIEIDSKHESLMSGDKSLKTVNSKRVISFHDQLVKLGLPDYIKALRKAGYVRLFPELRYDKIKGYGKAAGSWFNERLLGNQLKITRDGTKTFHSFRHTFITELFEAEIPEVTVAQIAGHERGDGESAKRYRKDQVAGSLQPYVNRVSFNLPTVAPFDSAAGLLAVESALDRKSRHPSAKI